MKKILPLLLILPFFTSCGSNNNNILSQEMLDLLNTSNITYNTDYQIYYYEINNKDSLEYVQRFDVVSKFVEGLYSIEAYIDNENVKVVSDHYEKDDKGFVVYSSVNIKNELEVNRAKDGDGSLIAWNDSVYINQLGKLKVDDFVCSSEGVYTYKLSELGSNLVESIFHAAVPTSFCDLESFSLKVENNEIVSFTFQEIESSEVYENCMYGRKSVMSVSNVGSTELIKNSNYAESEDNIELSNALNKMRSLTNYSISVSNIVDNQTQLLSRSFITENDIVREEFNNGKTYMSGVHTYNNKVYTFEPYADTYLLGTESNISISSLFPKFDFSPYVFKYNGEDSNGYKKYSAYNLMNAVLESVELVDVTSNYYNVEGTIDFFVKDGTLSRIEYPTYIFKDSKPIIVTQVISYSDLNKTEIGNNLWDNFITDFSELGDLVGWDDPRLIIDFTLIDGSNQKMTPNEIFKKALGEDNQIPFFINPSSLYEIDGSASNEDKVVSVEMVSIGGQKESIDNYGQTLISNGFNLSQEESIPEENLYSSSYTKDSITIHLMFMEDSIFILIELPLGDFAS